MLHHRAASEISRDEARADVMKVLAARDDLALFAEYVSDGWYRAYAMHHMIAYELQQVIKYLATDGKEGTQFLMILTPFQHGKSALVSRFFPAFTLGHLPNLRILEVSYGADLASEHSRYVRNMILSDHYQAVFGKHSPSEEPVVLASDSRSVSAWDLGGSYRGGMIASGIGGAVPGRAKGLVIWDDPIKGHKEAESQDVRDDAWDFYVSALRVRMIAGVLVMTHWNGDDPAGRIIRNMVTKPNGDKWKILTLPGLIEPGLFSTSKEDQRKKMLEGVYMPFRDPLRREVGDVLCPEMLSKTELLKIRETQGEYYFSALIQQTPHPKEGNTFKRDWFSTIVPNPPKEVWARIRAWDRASTTANNSPRTAGVKMSWGKDDYVYIEHVFVDRLTPAERDEEMIRIGKEDYSNDGPFLIWHPQDPGSAGYDTATAFNNMLANNGLYGTFDQVTGSKESFANMLATKAKAGRVRLVEGGWNEGFVEELSRFPRGLKDQTDAAGSAFNKLQQIVEELKYQQHEEELIYEERVSISPV